MPIPQNARKVLLVTAGVALLMGLAALTAQEGIEGAIEHEETVASISRGDVPSQDELDELRRRNALLETLLRASARRGASMAPGVEIDGPDVGAAEVAIDEVEARFLEFEQALTRTDHDPESDDVRWDHAVEDELRQMANELGRHVDLLSLRCVSWLCRVELRAAGEYDGAAEISAFMAKAATLFPESTTKSDDSGTLRLLFSASASPSAEGGLEGTADD